MSGRGGASRGPRGPLRVPEHRVPAALAHAFPRAPVARVCTPRPTPIASASSRSRASASDIRSPTAAPSTSSASSSMRTISSSPPALSLAQWLSGPSSGHAAHTLSTPADDERGLECSARSTTCVEVLHELLGVALAVEELQADEVVAAQANRACRLTARPPRRRARLGRGESSGSCCGATSRARAGRSPRAGGERALGERGRVVGVGAVQREHAPQPRRRERLERVGGVGVGQMPLRRADPRFRKLGYGPLSSIPRSWLLSMPSRSTSASASADSGVSTPVSVARPNRSPFSAGCGSPPGRRRRARCGRAAP